MSHPEDHHRAVIERIRRSDAEAFKEFFLRHQEEIYCFLFRYTQDRQAAEDLTQETFLSFWCARQTLRAELSARGYLFRIARNAALNFLARRHPVEPLPADDQLPLALLLEDPGQIFDRACLLDDFQQALGDLPERCRAVFILSRYHEMSYEEIAAALEISLQTVKNQISKAIAILRKRLAHHLE